MRRACRAPVPPRPCAAPRPSTVCVRLVMILRCFPRRSLPCYVAAASVITCHRPQPSIVHTLRKMFLTHLTVQNCIDTIPCLDPHPAQNAMAAPVILMIAIGSNEYGTLRTSYISTPAVLALSAGCVMGLAMNYFSWRLRELVSATSVTVIGASLARYRWALGI